MNWLSIIGLSLGGLVILFPVAFVSYLNVGGLYQARKRASNGKKTCSLVERIPTLACRADTDCPQGHICVNGTCKPEGA